MVTLTKIGELVIYNSVIKSRRVRWVGHVARMEHENFTQNYEGKRRLGRPRVDGRVIFEWILGK
jgi:hypothetical protein